MGERRDKDGRIVSDRRAVDIAGATDFPRDSAATVPRDGVHGPGAAAPTVPVPGLRGLKRTRVWPGPDAALSSAAAEAGPGDKAPGDSAATVPRDAVRGPGAAAPTVPVPGLRVGPRARVWRGPDAVGGWAAAEAGPGEKASGDAADQLPAGWLVVVDGPGKGRVATIGFGNNAIGRDPTQRVCLDYGDSAISRVGHAVVVYDPLGGKFHIKGGDGTNLTYVDDDLVLDARELRPFAHLRVGNTVLRFVPLCGPDFSWGTEPAAD